MAEWNLMGRYSGKECAHAVTLRTQTAGMTPLVEGRAYVFEQPRKGGNQTFSAGHLLVVARQVEEDDPTYTWMSCIFDPPVFNLAGGLVVREAVAADGLVRFMGPTAANAIIVEIDYTIIPPDNNWGIPAPMYPATNPINIKIRQLPPNPNDPIPYTSDTFSVGYTTVYMPKTQSNIKIMMALDPFTRKYNPPWDVIQIAP